MCDIAHTNGTPVSVESERWTDADLWARERSLEHDRERCPQCKLTPDAAKHVTATIEHCPTCAVRDARRNELGKLERGAEGRYVAWFVIDDPDVAAQASAWVQFTAEGAAWRKRYEAGVRE